MSAAMDDPEGGAPDPEAETLAYTAQDAVQLLAAIDSMTDVAPTLH